MHAVSILAPVHYLEIDDDSLIYTSRPWAHFTNDFSIVIKICWKFNSALIHVVAK